MFLVTIRFLGIEFFLENELDFPLYLTYVNSLPGGIFMGVLWVLLDRLLRKFFFRKARSFGVVVMVMTISFVLLIGAVIFSATWIISGSVDYALSYSFGPIAASNMIFSISAAFIFVFIQKLDQRMGPGVMLNYLTGKYFQPREEERIFLFMDLNSSTTIAEKLGHEQYSRLVQDCYRLLNVPIRDTKAEVYQYVGDEVVISWQAKTGISDSDCLKLFFLYSEILKEQEASFDEKYGVRPTFKAAAHIGKTMVAEVGQIKSEIAFHGDVLNTTARILGKCHELSEEFLVSGELISKWKEELLYPNISKGYYKLKGRKEEVEIYGIKNHPDM